MRCRASKTASEDDQRKHPVPRRSSTAAAPAEPRKNKAPAQGLADDQADGTPTTTRRGSIQTAADITSVPRPERVYAQATGDATLDGYLTHAYALADMAAPDPANYTLGDGERLLMAALDVLRRAGAGVVVAWEAELRKAHDAGQGAKRGRGDGTKGGGEEGEGEAGEATKRGL